MPFRLKGDEILLIPNIKASEPYTVGAGGINVMVTIDLGHIVDGHDYHDFPNKEYIWIDLNQLIDLQVQVNKLVKMSRALIKGAKK